MAITDLSRVGNDTSADDPRDGAGNWGMLQNNALQKCHVAF